MFFFINCYFKNPSLKIYFLLFVNVVALRNLKLQKHQLIESKNFLFQNIKLHKINNPYFSDGVKPQQQVSTVQRHGINDNNNTISTTAATRYLIPKWNWCSLNLML